MSKSDKRQKAVALKYQEDKDISPVVVASGYGPVAEKIITVAEERGIPVFRDDSAASLMCMLEVGRSIPPEMYEVVAAIYVHILNISGEIKHYKDNVPNIDTAHNKVQDIENAVNSGIRNK